MNVPEKLSILLNSPDYIAIDKPSGLASIPTRDGSVSAIELLSEQSNLPRTGSADPRIRPVHRIDQDTSGVLLFAKHVEAQRHVSHQFQNNAVEKIYLALVTGRPAEVSGVIDAPIVPHPADPRRMTTAKRGRRSVTQWQVEASFRHYTLLRVFPKTGKTHQIRVHLLSIGLPLAIDPIYNAHAPPLLLSAFKRGYRPKKDEPERPLIARLTLHAHRLSFTDRKGELQTIESPLPKDFGTSIKQLTKFDR